VDRQTDTHTQTRVTTIHFASSMTHAKCNKNEIPRCLKCTMIFLCPTKDKIFANSHPKKTGSSKQDIHRGINECRQSTPFIQTPTSSWNARKVTDCNYDSATLSTRWWRAVWGKVWIHHSWWDLHEVEMHPAAVSSPSSQLHSLYTTINGCSNFTSVCN